MVLNMETELTPGQMAPSIKANSKMTEKMVKACITSVMEIGIKEAFKTEGYMEMALIHGHQEQFSLESTYKMLELVMEKLCMKTGLLLKGSGRMGNLWSMQLPLLLRLQRKVLVLH